MRLMPNRDTSVRRSYSTHTRIALLALIVPMLVTSLPGHAQEEPPQLGVVVEAPHVIAGLHFDATAPTVTITLDSGGDGTVDHTWVLPDDYPDTGQDWWPTDPEGTSGNFQLATPFGCPDAVSISPGDIVTATAGTTSASHTVIDFAVTDVNVAGATVSGTTDPTLTATIGVFLFDPNTGSDDVRWPAFESSGDWVADFSDEVAAFAPGYDFNILAFDQNGHTTGIHRTIPESSEPPDVYAITAPVDPVEVNTEIASCTEFRDASLNDSHTMTIDWGDGTFSTLNGVASGPTELSHTYRQAGVYSPAVTVTDSTNGSDTMWFDYIVVYDPDGGFVTGSGWFGSPAGAYIADGALTGRAHFGFMSRYHKGATVPEGKTVFRFEVAHLDFRSTSYDWLVVAGDSTAKFKGIGTINGTGEYKFQIWAVDGDPDAVHIKIWTEDTGTELVVYDNGEQPTPIGAGAIVVHK